MAVVANTILSIWISGLVLCTALSANEISNSDEPYWGFYGHRLINRLAVFTLPPPLNKLFKANVNYIEQQSVAPDKRRYASPIEGIRHYMDMDKYPDLLESEGFPNQIDLILRHSSITAFNEAGDSIRTFLPEEIDSFYQKASNALRFDIAKHLYKLYEYGHFRLLPEYMDLHSWPRGTVGLQFNDLFSEHGILPYHLVDYQRRLTKGMRDGDWMYVLRLAAEIGHYISDAHVPLHTTSNYNGQMTNQLGIHAFWESRVPELFAVREFDLWVGSSQYIDDMEKFFWDILLESNSLVVKVLEEDAKLRADKSVTSFCYEERNGIVVRLECEDYTRLYAERLDGMVERQMRKAILAVSSCWLTAWIDAGSPEIDLVSQQEEASEPELPSSLNSKIRTHDNE